MVRNPVLVGEVAKHTETIDVCCSWCQRCGCLTTDLLLVTYGPDTTIDAAIRGRLSYCSRRKDYQRCDPYSPTVSELFPRRYRRS